MTDGEMYTREDLAPPPRNVRFAGPYGLMQWYLEWAIPGMGMFCEAYIAFSAGQIKEFQTAMWPTCFLTYTQCDNNMINHLANYIQICGIMAGMLFWGLQGDITGRKWGSRLVAAIMLLGVILLTFSVWVPCAYCYFVIFIVAQTWYGFGVGGEYPMASCSATEQSTTTPELRHLRARQVLLVFSNQGMGNLANALVILISMAFFNQTGVNLTFTGSRNVLALQYGVGAFFCLVMVCYRFVFLEESQMFAEEKLIVVKVVQTTGFMKHWMCIRFYFWRQWVASWCWVANDFAFYGNRLQQNVFLSVLFPTASYYVKQQWSCLNSFIALLGYYAAAGLCDKAWYGRVRCQWVGFMAMFVFDIIIYAQWNNMAVAGIASNQGAQAMQALYYLSSFFNQFGPNAITFLVAGEIFPTEIRTTNHGFAACMGKLGAITSSLWISYISDIRKVFLISAVWGLSGAIVTIIWLPETTGLDIEEYDRMHRCVLEGRFHEYHGEAVNPHHLSLWEIYVQQWHKQYDPDLDRQQFEAEIKHYGLTAAALLKRAVGSSNKVQPADPAALQRMMQVSTSAQEQL
jgi:MFS family permease